MYELDIHYLDVGQGDCTVIIIRLEGIEDNTTEFDERIVATIVIDCGTIGTQSMPNNLFYSRSDAAWNALSKKLEVLRVRRIDRIVVTHFDLDHYNGIVAMLQEYESIPETPTSPKQIRLKQLLEGTKIYDQGVINFKTGKVFRTEPPEYRVVQNLRRGYVGISHDEDEMERYEIAQDFAENAANRTFNSGFGPKRLLPIINERVSDEFESSFSGQDLYQSYVNSVSNSGINRQTERVFVGHFTQHQKGFGPVLSDPESTTVTKIPFPDWVRIQKRLWNPTSASASNKDYVAETAEFWTYSVKNQKVDPPPSRRIKPSRTRLAKKMNGLRLQPRFHSKEMYAVQALPLDYLVGQDILEDLLHGDVQLICIAANGFVLERMEENDMGEPDTVHTKLAYSGIGTDNHFSLGFLLKYENFTHWFGGDLEKEQENGSIEGILSIAPNGLTAMKASHHGSNAASPTQFLTALRPTVVFISAGKSPDFQLPGVHTLNEFNKHSFIQNVFMTGTDKYNTENTKLLPSNFPNYYTIFQPTSKFIIAGSDRHQGDIQLTISHSDATKMAGSVNFFDQNREFRLKDSSFFLPLERDGEFLKSAPQISLNLTEYDTLRYLNENNELIDPMDVHEDDWDNHSLVIQRSMNTVNGTTYNRFEGKIHSRMNTIRFRKTTNN